MGAIKLDAIQDIIAPSTSIEGVSEILKQYVDNPSGFANLLIEYGCFKSDGQFLYQYKYESGYFKKLLIKQAEIDAIHDLIKPSMLTEKIMREIIYYLKSSLIIRVRLEDFNKQGHRFINGRNGVLDMDTMQLLKHNPEFMFNYYNNAEFKQGERKTNAFDSYCNTSLEGDGGKRQLLLEMIGYILTPTNKAKKACFIIGPQHSGKSTVQNLIVAIVGRENIASIALQDLSNRFSNSMLSDVRVNMQFELSNKEIRDINDFKAIVGGDYCKGEKKGGALYTFRHTAKLIFGGNHLPPLHNPQMSEIYIDRIAILKLDQSIKKESWDLSLESKLLAEKDEIYSLAMYAYHELYKNNFNFSIPDSSKEYLKEYQLELNNVRGFFNQFCKYEKDSRVYSKALYEGYVKHCKDNAIEPFKKETFSKQLADMTNLRPKNLRVNGGPVNRGFEGIKLLIE